MDKKKNINWFDQAIAICFYGLIYFTPISIALSETFAGLILLFFFIKRGILFRLGLKGAFPNQREAFGSKFKRFIVLLCGIIKPEKSCLAGPTGFFILACGLSIFKSDYLALSLSGFFFKVLEWTYLYFIFVESMNTRKKLHIFVMVFFISLLLVSVNGVVQYFVGRGFIHGHSLTAGRVASSFRHPNDFGAYLVMICPLLFCLSQNYDRRNSGKLAQRGTKARKRMLRSLFLSFLFLLSTLCIGLTYSRGAWISYFIALAFCGLINKRNFLPSLAIIALFFGIFSPPLSHLRQASFLSDDIKRHSILKDIKQYNFFNGIEKEKDLKAEQGKGDASPGRQDEESVWQLKSKLLKTVKSFGGSGRSNFWKEAIMIIRDSPFLGTGVNTYSKVAPRYKIVWGGYPHNCYLHMAAEIGLFGVGTFFWIIFKLIGCSIRNFRKIEDELFKTVLLGLLAGMIGFLIHSSVDTNFYSVQLGNLMWVVFGLIVAVQRVAMASGE